MSKNEELKSKQEIEKYLERPYTFTVSEDTDEDGKPYFYAQVNELPGCISDDKTAEDALRNIKDVMYDWIETTLLSSCRGNGRVK